MQTERNKWIEEVLSSADSMQHLRAPDLTSQVLARAARQPGSSATVWRIAASVALLIAVNVGTIVFHSSSHPAAHQSSMLIDLGVSEREDVGTLFFGR